MSKKIPVLFAEKKDCCGCTACCSVCPKNAIYMKEDEQGFEYPHIEQTKCITCYKCIQVCPLKVERSYIG